MAGERGSDSGNWWRVFVQGMTLPWWVMWSGMDAALRLFGDSQRGAAGDRRAPIPFAASAPVEGGTMSEQQGWSRDSAGSSREPSWGGRDRDLGGDDVKLVHYRVLYAKPDEEALLIDGDDIVNYRTDPTAYGGLKVAEFVERLNQGYVPAAWRSRQQRGEMLPRIEDVENRKHVRVSYEVVERFPRGDAEYDKKKVRALEDIRNSIQSVTSRIG